MERRSQKRKHSINSKQTEGKVRLRISQSKHISKPLNNGASESEGKDKKEHTANNEEDNMPNDNSVSISDRTDFTDELAHFNECVICEDGGKLICCDYCPRVYHARCLQMSNSPNKSEDWMCPTCVATIKKKRCKICEESISKLLEKYALKCPLCKCLMHFECMAIPLNLLLDTPKYHSFMEDGLDKFKDPDGKIYLEYLCIDCMNGRKVDSILDFYNRETTDPNASVENNYYLCKFKKTSLYHAVWIVHDIMRLLSKAKLSIFLGKYLDPEEGAIIEDATLHGIAPEKLDAERVVDRSIKSLSSGERTYYLIKWKKMPYSECTWESKEFIEEYFMDKVTKFVKKRTLEDSYDTTEDYLATLHAPMIPTDFIPYVKQPDFINTGILRDYQLEGLNWLISMWYKKCNALLSDEMGLGKTIQAICLLKYLRSIGVTGSVLVITPLTTLDNWLRELEYWYEECDAVVLGDDKESRKIAVSRDLFYRFKSERSRCIDKPNALCKFNVLLTSPAVIINPGMTQLFHAIKWEVVIIDESHALKNKECRLTKKMEGLHWNFLLMLTGTPMQNRLTELGNLIEVISPSSKSMINNQIERINNANKPRRAASTAKKPTTCKLEDTNTEELVKKFQEMLRPFILRRVKKDVLKDLPHKKEHILLVDMTPLQKKMYRIIYSKNAKLIKEVSTKIKITSIGLSNIMMSLRLCSNHPLLLNELYRKNISKNEYWVDDDIAKVGKDEWVQKYIIDSSEKIKLLDRMLAKLLPEHKVLIFSQFTMMLNILEEYMVFKHIPYKRLDGSTVHSYRQTLIDNFNKEGSIDKIMIISTRTGGLGINLASADTVFLFDSDYNPHVDEQALSRVHRIGQKNKVLIFRFITRLTIEQRVIEIAKEKVVLDKMIIKSNKQSNIDFKEILKFGIEKLFNDDLVSEKIEYTDKQLDDILQRGFESQLAQDDTADFLSSFKIAPHEGTEKIEEDKAFDKIINEEAKKQEEEVLSQFGKGKRVRRNPNVRVREPKKEVPTESVKPVKEPEKEAQEDKKEEEKKEMAEEKENEKDKEKDKEKEKEHTHSKSHHSKKSKSRTPKEHSKADDTNEEPKPTMLSKLMKNKAHIMAINNVSNSLCDTLCKQIEVDIVDDEVVLKDTSKQYQFEYKLNCMTNELRYQLVTWGFNEMNRSDFISALMKYGVLKGNWASLFWRIKSQELSSSINVKTVQEFETYSANFISCMNAIVSKSKEGQPHFLCGIYSPKEVLQRMSDIALINELIEKFKDNPDSFNIDSPIYNEANQNLIKNKVKWKPLYDFLLLSAMQKHGFNELECSAVDTKHWPFLSAASCDTKQGIYSEWGKLISTEIEQEITESTDSLNSGHMEYVVD